MDDSNELGAHIYRPKFEKPNRTRDIGSVAEIIPLLRRNLSPEAEEKIQRQNMRNIVAMFFSQRETSRQLLDRNFRAGDHSALQSARDMFRVLTDDILNRAIFAQMEPESDYERMRTDIEKSLAELTQMMAKEPTQYGDSQHDAFLALLNTLGLVEKKLEDHLLQRIDSA